MSDWVATFCLWAQAPIAPQAQGPAAGTDPIVVPLSALKRWFASLTLSPPEALPSSFALWAWLAGWGALLLLAIVMQGPRNALTQLADLAGLIRLLAAAVMRVTRAGRLLAALFAAVVVSWTAWQTFSYTKLERIEELAALRKTRSLGELSLEQGVLAGLTPFRDVFGLGDSLLLLICAGIVVFKLSADRWSTATDSRRVEQRPIPPGTTLCWGCAWLYVMYRIAAIIAGKDDLPLGGCIFLEALMLPVLMLVSDGILLAWALDELKGASENEGVEGIDASGAVALAPGSMLACLLGLPARFVAMAVTLLVSYHLTAAASARVGLRWIVLGWGLVILQAAAMPFAGLVGAVPWTGGRVGSAISGYGAMLRAEGGRIAGLTFVLCLASAAVSALAYVLVLSLPPQAWLLSTADSYAHYGTLPLGLIGVAALVEIGSRSIPLPVPPSRSVVGSTANLEPTADIRFQD